MPRKSSSVSNGEQASSISSVRFLSGFALVIVGLLLFVALSSFFITGGADRSIFDMPVSELFTNVDIEVDNPLGRFGAWVADLLVTNGVGVMALLLPWLIAVMGLNVIVRGLFNIRRQIIFCACAAMWGSVAMGFFFSRFADSFYSIVGGSFGHFAAQWLKCVIGPVGTLALILFVLFAFISVKVQAVRDAIAVLLSKIHITLPQIRFSTIEGETIEDDDESESAEDERGDGEPQDSDSAQDASASENNPEEATEAPERQPKDVGGLHIVRPDGDDEVEPLPAETTEPKKDATLEIVNSQDEELVDDIHRGIDTKYDPTSDLSNYKLPPISLLKDDYPITTQSKQELEANSNRIIEALANFNIKIDDIKATVGPTVTLYEIVPAPGVRISKIQGLEKDIALSLQALGIRIIAPLPGRGSIGIEVPNSKPQVVSMNSVIRSKKFQESEYELPVALGKNISNETLVFDLAKTPHLLVAGATGQGKSVGLNAIITSILYKKHPSQVKFVMVDPKMVEFSIYKVLEKFFLAKMEGEDDAIITDVEKVKNTLLSLTIEMDNRYKLLEKANVRQIKEYNAKFIDRMLNPEKGHRFLPYIIVIIDEFADLIMQAGKEIEMPIARIAQKARAVGIHMILATQRPSTNIITGVIKAQFPSRIAFKVASMTDSRTILDQTGAQYLIGRGDMLLSLAGSMSPVRVQCAFVDTPEVDAITEFISNQQGYLGAYELPEYVPDGGTPSSDGGDSQSVGKFDSKIREVAIMVVRSQNGSTSNIQRLFEVGYNRAGKLTDQLERMGIVSAPDRTKQRTVLVQTEVDLEKIFDRFGV